MTGRPDLPMLVRSVKSGGFIRVNRLFSERIGYVASELRLEPLFDWIEPKDRERFQQALEQGEGALRAHHRTDKGEWVEFDWRVGVEDGEPVVLGVLNVQRESETQRACLPVAEAPKSMYEILEAMALIVEAERPGKKCSVLLLDQESRRIKVGAGPSFSKEYNSAVERLVIGPCVGSCGTAAFWNERVIVEDIQSDPLWMNLRTEAANAGVAACWSHPVLSEAGQVLGAAALYSAEPCVPTQQELDGLAAAASMFGLAIERSYAEQALAKSEACRIKRESELEDQFNRAAKMEALGVLAGGLAHDFNNMLASVIGNSELALELVPEGGPAYEMLKDIDTASRSAADLCAQMLAFAGGGVISKQRLEWNSVIRELGCLLQATVSKKATLEYELCEDPVFVEADKSQLSQVVMNLISNAAESLENETGQIVATTGIRDIDESELIQFQSSAQLKAGRYVSFTVSDTGCGMSSETQSRIFDPFYTTKFAGRGIGMAAVRGIIHRHHGHIGLASELGKGTTITVLLPQVRPPKVAVEAVAQEGDQQSAKCVLVVDDEPMVRTVLMRILLSAGFEVVKARSGLEAIEILQGKRRSIDCVLMDLSMPGLDGEETFRELRKLGHDVPVVLNSGYAEQDIVSRIEGMGFAGVLQKPVSARVLVAKLNSILK